MTQDMIDAVNGLIPYEDLEDEEIFELERLVAQAVVEKIRQGFAPGSSTLQ